MAEVNELTDLLLICHLNSQVSVYLPFNQQRWNRGFHWHKPVGRPSGVLHGPPSVLSQHPASKSRRRENGPQMALAWSGSVTYLDITHSIGNYFPAFDYHLSHPLALFGCPLWRQRTARSTSMIFRTQKRNCLTKIRRPKWISWRLLLTARFWGRQTDLQYGT